MPKILSRDEVLEIYVEMIEKAMEDYRNFEDPESRRKFMNSIGQTLNLFNSVSKSDRMDKIEQEIKRIKERIEL